MSAEPSDETIDDDLEGDLSQALISHCKLSADAVERIRDTMRTMHLAFSEAAVHIGLITPEDVEDVAVWVRRLSTRRGASLVETALRRQAVTRKVTVRHGDQVKPGSQLILAHDPDNPRSEKIRALRTELLLLNDRANQANIFAFLSPQPAEGRSQLCAELAISFAQLGRRTLLVDADLRHPRQHALFGADNQWGLAQALAHGEPPYLHGVEGLPHMSLLTSGTIPPNPLELLSDGRFERMISDWRYNYEFVLIDTPPVTLYADGLAVATLARRVLLLSRAKVTPFKEMKEMLRRLATTQSEVLGAVINNF